MTGWKVVAIEETFGMGESVSGIMDVRRKFILGSKHAIDMMMEEKEYVFGGYT